MRHNANDKTKGFSLTHTHTHTLITFPSEKKTKQATKGDVAFHLKFNLHFIFRSTLSQACMKVS